MTRIGLMGGTFNPIHLGHIQIARDVYEEFALDRMIFIPAGRPPHKRVDELAEEGHRLDMVRLAIAGIPGFELSDIELARPATTYTVDTMRALKRGDPQAEYYYLIGTDTVLELPHWRQFAVVARLTRFIAVRRPDTDIPAVERTMEALRAQYGAKVLLSRAKGPDISSTQIRRRVRGGQGIGDLVPQAVADYIDEEKLYR